MIEITNKQRAFLRAKSNSMPDLVFIGKEGLTQNVIDQINTNLFAHELIKVKVQKGSEFSSKELIEQIQNKTQSHVVDVIGSKIIIYKPTTKADFKHYL